MPWVVGGLRAPGGASMEASASLARAGALSSLTPPTDPLPGTGGCKGAAKNCTACAPRQTAKPLTPSPP